MFVLKQTLSYYCMEIKSHCRCCEERKKKEEKSAHSAFNFQAPGSNCSPKNKKMLSPPLFFSSPNSISIFESRFISALVDVRFTYMRWTKLYWKMQKLFVTSAPASIRSSSLLLTPGLVQFSNAFSPVYSIKQRTNNFN